MPKQIEAHLPGSVREAPWTRTVAVGSLITGVFLLLTGNRKAGVAVAAAGTVLALAEDPESLKEWWESMPRYVKTVQQFLVRIEGFGDQLAAQGETVRRLMRR